MAHSQHPGQKAAQVRQETQAVESVNDCWRRCIARLAGVDWELVPNFVVDDPAYWLADTCEWLDTRGLTLLAMVSVKDGTQLDVSPHVLPVPPYIAVGLTETGTYHAVVFDADGTQWDPHGGPGVLTVLGMYWVVPLG